MSSPIENSDDTAIKDILYEVALKEHLLALGKKRTLVRYAILLSGLLIITLGYIGIRKALDRPSTISPMALNEYYTVPDFRKSRSVEKNVITEQTTLLDNKQYLELITILNSSSSLSETDKFAKAHLYFLVDSLQESIHICKEVAEDDYYYEDYQWLQFLIAVKQGKERTHLENFIPLMNSNHKLSAIEILNYDEN